MHLYLLRHAKAEPDSPSGRDFDRPLSDVGRRQTSAINRQLAQGELPLPAAVVSSPAVRALETARGVLHQLGDAEIETDERIWNASVPDLLDVLADRPDGPEPLMLVGHNPGFEQLVRWLTASIPVPGVKTCTLVDLRLEGRPGPGSAEMLGLILPGKA